MALDALIAERSVSAAADRLHLSQPAMSGALSRIRQFFCDPLLVMSGRRMVLTPRALELAGPVRSALEQIEFSIAGPLVFDPATSDRRFLIEASDFIMEVLLAPAARQIAKVAPKVRLSMIPRSQATEATLDRGEIDLIIIPAFYSSPAHPSELLFEEDHVVVGCISNGLLQEPLAVETFFDFGFVAVNFEQGRLPAFAEAQMGRTSHPRRIEITVPSFSDVPAFLIGTSRVAIMHRRLAQSASRRLPLRFVDLPMQLPHLTEVMQHSSVRKDDFALKWLRQLLLNVAKEGVT